MLSGQLDLFDYVEELAETISVEVVHPKPFGRYNPKFVVTEEEGRIEKSMIRSDPVAFVIGVIAANVNTAFSTEKISLENRLEAISWLLADLVPFKDKPIPLSFQSLCIAVDLDPWEKHAYYSRKWNEFKRALREKQSKANA
jgi:hypothetical protein